jgi:SAM-dependent methyltransferase
MRRSVILEGITKDMRGIEIAPWFAPLTPKRDGFNCATLDVFDKPALLRKAEIDPNIPREGIALIEDVDFVGSATEIAEIVPIEMHGTFDYIVSSHNFEHLPNPIAFLQGCQKILKEGGILSMAVPNMRACFDIFRPHTTIIDWLFAFKQKRTKPSPEQLFQSNVCFATLTQNGSDTGAFTIHDPVNDIVVKGDLEAQYKKWLASSETDVYEDAHCSAMTPASFQLLILECGFLGLSTMAIESVSGPAGCEFYVRLVNSKTPGAVPDINAARTRLMRRILEERSIRTEPQALPLMQDDSSLIEEPIVPHNTRTWRKSLSLNFARTIAGEFFGISRFRRSGETS